ncbi:MAG TPA: hypothetical protein VOA41_17610 [Candidatus Dormibacteraeota bacterium]|nr:hypothetical protein [Candidatus Dormibacteraeota bacterium]
MLVSRKLAYFLLPGILLLAGAAVAQEIATAKKDNAVKVQMRNVRYHFTDQVTVYISALRGELIPIGENDFPVFDDRNSFRLRISGGEIAIGAESLANVLNSYVFSGQSSPLKSISIAIEKGKLKVKGKLRKGDIPFETEGSVSATPDGKIRLHSDKIKALHLPAKGLMELFGIEMSDFIKTGKVAGVQAEKEDLILDPQKILPPPHIEGPITAIRLEGGNIVQIFGTPPNHSEEKANAGNYMAYRGNRLRFGKLTMNDADMTLLDMDPKDPFDFYLDHYKEQLAAGYTKITLSFGLRVFMKDFDKLGRNARAQQKAPTTR